MFGPDIVSVDVAALIGIDIFDSGSLLENETNRHRNRIIVSDKGEKLKLDDV